MSSHSGRYRYAKIAILPILAHVAILGIYEPHRHLAWTLVLIGIGFLGIVAAEASLTESNAKLAAFIVATAVILRLLMLPLPPTLSDDLYRYLWDGEVLSSGHNPYLLAPEDPEVESLRGPLWDRLPHKDVPTVYPPVAEAAFAVAASLPASVWVWKTLLASVDVFSCVLLIVILRWRDLPINRAIWYAWNPLVTIEIAGMGHVDGLGVAGVLLAFVVLQLPRRRSIVAACAAAVAVLIKIVPVLAYPILGRLSRDSKRFLAIAGLLVVIGAFPVALSVGGVPPGLIKYGVSWEFNGPLFEPLWRVYDRFDSTEHVEDLLDRLKSSWGRGDLWNRVYPFNYPQLLAKITLLFGLGVALINAWKQKDEVVAMRRVFGSVVMFSATVYPWYLLWVLPWADAELHPTVLRCAPLSLGLRSDLDSVRDRPDLMQTKTYALKISYRGTDYAGWQRQSNAVSVQQKVEEALESQIGRDIVVQGAGRTDSGVHARGQIAHLDVDREIPISALVHGTNTHLPDDIRVIEAFRMPDGFHARKCARSKEYRYRLMQARVLSPLDSLFALQVTSPLDLAAMQSATDSIVGEHDFTAFTLSGGSHRSPIRTVYRAEWIASDDLLELRIEGSGFLRGMVRSVVGTLIEVGMGKRAPSDGDRLRGGRPRSEAGPTAAACGLCLHRVDYPPPWQPIVEPSVLA